MSEAEPHDCLDRSGVIFCENVTGEPHWRYGWMDHPLTQWEIDQTPDGFDLRECRVCHRRFPSACNFEEDFS